MRTTVIALSIAAATGLVCCQSACAAPAAPNAMQNAAGAASAMQLAQYREYRSRHHVVKCYRDLIFGPYRCHYYRRHWWPLP